MCVKGMVAIVKVRDRSIFMGIRDREMSGGLGQNNRWPRISKSLKIQRVIQDIVSNARLTDAEGQNASIDDKTLRLSQF